MAKIVDLKNLSIVTDKIKKNKKSIVLVGGCFDIIHIGHIKFLKEAKKEGNYLLVLLESDETVKKLKGTQRPHFPQKDRAEVLSSIKYIDYVILMEHLERDEEYNKLVLLIKPDVIAVTENDPHLSQKEKQAEMVNGKIKIIPHIKTFSSSQLAKLIGVE